MIFPDLPSLSASWRPDRPGPCEGPWSGHRPFAYDLMTFLRPSLLVELGTYYGESYFTFCQAVHENQAPCVCYAVDTWRGDPHGGRYGDEVYEQVRAYNARNYAPFSYLVRASFDAALGQFSDETIELLHIDGYHTYEAVRHDFETWIPKVRDGGVVLMHDTAVRNPDFGVWRLWEELRGRFQTFSFPHGSGLGVLLKSSPSGSVCEFLKVLISAG